MTVRQCGVDGGLGAAAGIRLAPPSERNSFIPLPVLLLGFVFLQEFQEKSRHSN